MIIIVLQRFYRVTMFADVCSSHWQPMHCLVEVAFTVRHEAFVCHVGLNTKFLLGETRLLVLVLMIWDVSSYRKA